MSKITIEQIKKIVEEKNVRFIELQFTDVFGILKSVTVTANRIESIAKSGCAFDGSSIDGFARIEESDMVLLPDLDTFRVLPWSGTSARNARIICDVYKTDGTPYEGCPRNILKKQLALAAEKGYTFNIGPECEFFLLHTDENGKPVLEGNDEGGYFDMAPVDRGGSARKEICLTLEEMGFEIEASHHEVAEGQHEIDFKYGDALEMADDVMTFKLVVKRVAQSHGLYATFMPKPIFGKAGSGMHINMSLSKDGKNIFADKDDINGISQKGYNFLAGIMKRAKALAAITNPTINSYKRLVPGFEAPCHIAWSAKNRSPLIRIPSARGAATRIELRNPDPTANPYLAFACILAAGMEGMEKNMKPCKPVDKNIYELTASERKRRKISMLPSTLDSAIEALKKDDLVVKVMGKSTYEKYISAKLAECSEYNIRVSRWEIDNYLRKY